MGFPADRRKRQADPLGKIEGQRLERPGFPQHGDAALLQRRGAGEDLGDIAQFLQAFDHHHAGAGDLRLHQGPVASHRAGMSRRTLARGARRARVEQHDRLARRLCASGQFQEPGGIAELLDDHRDHPGVRFVDHPGDIVLDARGGLVAGRDPCRDAELLAGQRRAQHRRHRTRLRDDADTGPVRGRDRRHLDEGERHPGDIIGEAEAIRPLDYHSMLSGDARDLGLRGQPLLAALGEPRREDDRRAYPARGQRPHRVEHGGAGNGEHGGIDAVGQLVDSGEAGPPLDRVTLGVDQVDVARKAVADKIGEHRRAERAGLLRCADNGDRAGGEQAGEIHCRRPFVRRGGISCARGPCRTRRDRACSSSRR